MFLNKDTKDFFLNISLRDDYADSADLSERESLESSKSAKSAVKRRSCFYYTAKAVDYKD
jgi:hypothetical protein